MDISVIENLRSSASAAFIKHFVSVLNCKPALVKGVFHFLEGPRAPDCQSLRNKFPKHRAHRKTNNPFSVSLCRAEVSKNMKKEHFL